MGKDNESQKQPVTINGVEYDASTFNEEQTMLLNHVVDLDRKLASMQFQAAQISVGRDAFIAKLEAALTSAPEEAPAFEALQ